MKRNHMTITTTVSVEIDAEVEEERRVRWEFSPFDPGVCSGPVEACYPPEGGELIDASFLDGTSALDWLYSHGVLERAENEAFDMAMRG